LLFALALHGSASAFSLNGNPIQVGSVPTGFALDASGARLVVVNANPFSAPRRGSLSVINPLTGQPIRADIPLGVGSTERVAVTSDGQRAYVAVADRVDAVDLQTGDVTPIQTGTFGPGDASAVVITPNNGKAYVTNRTTDTVTVIDTTTGSATYHQPIRTISLGGGFNTAQPYGAALTPDGSALYVASGRTRTVYVIATSTDSIVATIPISGVGPSSGAYSTAVGFSPDGAVAYVGFEGFLAAINTETRSQQGEPLGPYPTAATAGGPILDLAPSGASNTLLAVLGEPTAVLAEVTITGPAGVLDEIALTAPVGLVHPPSRDEPVYVLGSGNPGRVYPVLLGEQSKIIYIAFCGGDIVFEVQCNSSAPGVYDPGEIYFPSDPASIASAYSGLDAVGYHLAHSFPTAVTQTFATGRLRDLPAKVRAATLLIESAHRTGDRVYIAGFSLGGTLAIMVTDALEDRGIPVRLLALVDAAPVRSRVIGPNALAVLNFHHRRNPRVGADLCPVAGATFVAEDPDQTTVENHEIQHPDGPDRGFCANHKNMDNHPTVWATIRDRILTDVGD
jgi:YVTN family beta-propeller protein